MNANELLLRQYSVLKTHLITVTKQYSIDDLLIRHSVSCR